MAETYFSLVVWTDETDMDQFKDCLESIDEQEYREFELYILDNNPSNAIEVTIKEFFPEPILQRGIILSILDSTTDSVERHSVL